MYTLEFHLARPRHYSPISNTNYLGNVGLREQKSITKPKPTVPGPGTEGIGKEKLTETLFHLQLLSLLLTSTVTR